MDAGMSFIAATCTQAASKLWDDLKVTHTGMAFEQRLKANVRRNKGESEKRHEKHEKTMTYFFLSFCETV